MYRQTYVHRYTLVAVLRTSPGKKLIVVFNVRTTVGSSKSTVTWCVLTQSTSVRDGRTDRQNFPIVAYNAAVTSISADADEPRVAALRPSRSTCIELDAVCDQQATIISRCR